MNEYNPYDCKDIFTKKFIQWMANKSVIDYANGKFSITWRNTMFPFSAQAFFISEGFTTKFTGPGQFSAFMTVVAIDDDSCRGVQSARLQELLDLGFGATRRAAIKLGLKKQVLKQDLLVRRRAKQIAKLTNGIKPSFLLLKPFQDIFFKK